MMSTQASLVATLFHVPSVLIGFFFFFFFRVSAEVCGTAPCAEIDIMEANRYAFLSTLHRSSDPFGDGAGYGGGTADYSGMRTFNGAAYGPKSHIDTERPFTVTASFPTTPNGALKKMHISLSQQPLPPTSPATGQQQQQQQQQQQRRPELMHKLEMEVGLHYGNPALLELTAALQAGMTT